MTLQRTPKAPPPRLILLLLCLFPVFTVAQYEGAPAPLADGDAEQAATADQAPPADPPPEPPRFASRGERDRELLAERFPEEARWLTLPEPETRALALYRPAMAEPKGALLMFYSADNPPHWPPPLANLRQSLPRNGWATFAVTLPTPEPPPVPERPTPEPPPAPAETDEESGEEGTEETADEGKANEEEAVETQAAAEEEEAPPPEIPLPSRPERIAYHVNAALEWMAENGQGNLVVLVDPLSAPEVLAVLQPQLEAGARGEPPSTGESPLSGPVRALVLINRHGGVELSAEQLNQIFVVPELPILDVFVGPSALLQEQQRRHRDIAGRERLEHYQGLMMGAPDVHDPDNERSFWVRRIQGFMQRQAEGVEVNVPANRGP